MLLSNGCLKTNTRDSWLRSSCRWDKSFMWRTHPRVPAMYHRQVNTKIRITCQPCSFFPLVFAGGPAKTSQTGGGTLTSAHVPAARMAKLLARGELTCALQNKFMIFCCKKLIVSSTQLQGMQSMASVMMGDNGGQAWRHQPPFYSSEIMARAKSHQQMQVLRQTIILSFWLKIRENCATELCTSQLYCA